MSVVRLEPRGAEGQAGGLAAGNIKYVTALQALTQVVTPEQESGGTGTGKTLAYHIPRRTLAEAYPRARPRIQGSGQRLKRGKFKLALYAPSRRFSHHRRRRVKPVAGLSTPSSPAATLGRQAPLAPARPGGGDNVVKRSVMSCARKLHDFPFFFTGMVKAFRGLQRLGVNVTPNHFYWPVPDLAQLEKRRWPIYPTLPHSSFDLKKQVDLGWELSSAYGRECCFPGDAQNGIYHYNNGYFEAVDAEVAYCMVRHFKPSRVIEVGTGYSTRVLAAALEKNRECDHLEAELVSIDPFPERFSGSGWVELIPKAIQDVDLEFFDCLE